MNPAEEKPEGKRSKKRQYEKVIAALLMYDELEDVASFTGLSVSTVKRWLKKPAFAIQYAKARQALVNQAVGRASASLVAAISTLRKNMCNEDPKIAIQAADKLLAHTAKMSEIANIELRLLQLEEKLQQANKSEPPDDDEYLETTQ